MKPTALLLPALLASPLLSQEAPNVILVLADDLGYGELGSYGQEHIETPNLDRLAAEGMRFTQHYSGAPVCAPSRYVLMTGRNSGHATIRNNLKVQSEGQTPIPSGELTLGELLKGAGYATGVFGKWGLGFPGSEGDPLAQGFDRFFGYNCQVHAHNFYPRYLWSDDETVDLEGNDRGLTGAQYSHDVIEAELLDFIRANKDRPFFCYVPSTIPHLALQVPESTLAQYRGRWEETPYEGRSYLPHPTPRAAYAAMITHLDASVGRVMELLQELELEERTLVLFTSDNGATHLNPQVDVEFFKSSGALRGLKGSVYEGGVRVPLIARWKGQVPAGATSSHLSAFEDYMPTLAAVAGVELSTGTDGISFLPTLLGDPEAQEQHEYLFWDFPGYGGQIAVRRGRWKAVRRGLKKNADAPLELYDLENDPGEGTDVAVDHPDIALEMARIMIEARTTPAEEKFRFGTYGDG